MKMLLLAAVVTGLSGAAIAQDTADSGSTGSAKTYPACSRTITDSCIEKSTPQKAVHHPAHKMTHRNMRHSAPS